MTDVLRPSADPAEAVDERRIPNLAAAIVGNGELLVTLSARGEVEKLFWPHIDWGQHLGEFRVGLAGESPTTWLDEAPYTHSQRYVSDASIVETTATDPEGSAVITDFVLPDDPVLIRNIAVCPETSKRRLVVYVRPEIEESPRYGGAYVDRDTGVLVFYRRETAIAVAASEPAVARTGRIEKGRPSPALTDACRGDIAEGGVEYGVVDGALVSDFAAQITVVAAFASDAQEAIALVTRTLARSGADLVAARADHDRRTVEQAPEPTAAGGGVRELYRRSLLVFELLADRRTGGVIAAPEMDGEFARSGGYGFVWGRDMAFSILAFLAAGRDDLARKGIGWLLRTQSPEGLWLHRHWTNGSLAPSWGLHQIDETGAALFAFEAVWRELEDAALDAEMWPAARRAADFLVGFREDTSGLPLPSVDLWEERYGQHAYSSASVAAGLRAASEIARRHDPSRAAAYEDAGQELAAALDEQFWDDEARRYRRSIPAPAEAGRAPLRYPAEMAWSTSGGNSSGHDPALDSSLLGLSWPFVAVAPKSARMRDTVSALRSRLLTPAGLKRYEGDDYAGGNAWVLATLWLALWARQTGDIRRYEESLRVATRAQTTVGLLPEQVSADGRPAWVVPLTWSHAMYVLAVRPELKIVRDLTASSSR